MKRLTAVVLALVFLYGAFPFSARAVVTLVAPVELQGKIDKVKDILADPEADAGQLRLQADGVFDQAQDTHHLPVSGIGHWERPEALSAPGEEANIGQMLGRFKGLLIREPPPAIAQDVRQRLMEDYVALEDLAGKDAVKKDEDGQLPGGAAAAYVWNIAKSAKDGAVEGMMLLQPSLVKASKQIGEFVLATVGAHEPRHRISHIRDAKSLADDVQKAEVDAFYDEGAIMQWMDPSGEKFMYLWTRTVEQPGTPEFVTEYVKHLAKVRHAYSQGRPAIEQLVKELGYQDRHGLFDEHEKAAHPESGSPSHP